MMRIKLTLAALATASTLSGCGDMFADPCMDLQQYPTPAAQQQCQTDRAARLAAMPTGGGGGSRESLADSQARSGAMEPGETSGPNGTTDSGGDAGFGSISG